MIRCLLRQKAVYVAESYRSPSLESKNNEGEQLDYKIGLKAPGNNLDSHRHLYKVLVVYGALTESSTLTGQLTSEV